MKTAILRLAVVSTSAVLLAGCASAPSVDMAAAREWVDTLEAEPEDPRDVATLGMQVDTDMSPDSEVRADVTDPIRIAHVEVRCFGDGDVSATVTVSLLGGHDGTRALSQEIPCDTEPHRIVFDGASADGVTLQGTATAPTYLYATAVAK